ncbi:LIM and senescent cell antigen-like-containing domain protein 2 [Massospora cicadina]|nr:LIM and senescent cell antigen-like-containing domain protein 2 [Massospora cicadina]
MGFCLSCGELANTPRCPRCKGKVSGKSFTISLPNLLEASAAGLSSRDAWSATYLENQNKKVHAPNLDKLTRKNCFDATLPSLNGSSTFSEASSPCTLLSDPGTSKSDRAASADESSKCFRLIDIEAEKLLFLNKFYHKGCLPCSLCGKMITDSPAEVESEAYCRPCFISSGVSSNSSPTLMTPENERVDTVGCPPVSNGLKLGGGIPDTGAHAQLSEGATSGAGLLKINKLRTLRTDPAPRRSLEVPAQNAPAYSRTFNQLQATVNNKSAPPASIRTRPRKSSEASGRLSFADLLNSRRGQDSRLGTLPRRPLSMIGTELTKRSNLSATQKNLPVQDGPESISAIAQDLNRLALSRPNSVNLDGRGYPNVSDPSKQGLLSRDAIKRANRAFSLLPQRSPGQTQGLQPCSRALGTNVSPAVVSQPVESTPVSPHEKIKAFESTPSSTPSRTSFKSPNSGPAIKGHVDDSSLSPKPLPHSSNSKLKCNKCEVAILDTWFKLPDGRVLHRECFQCQHCKQMIEDGKYSVYDGQEYHTDVSLPSLAKAYFIQCLLQLPISPMSDASLDPEDFCDRCNSAIVGPCFTLTNGRQYHPNCFICAGCQKRFDQGTYVSQGDKEYHRQCVPKREPFRCAKCSLDIQGVFVTNNGLNFHSECFRCTGCHKVITPSTPFGEVAQQPYCEPCLVHQRTARQSSFALSAARQEQRRSTNSFPSIRP